MYTLVGLYDLYLLNFSLQINYKLNILNIK